MKRLFTILSMLVAASAGAQLTTPYSLMVNPTNGQVAAPGGTKFWDSNAPIYKVTLNWLNLTNWSNGNASTVFSSGTVPEARSAHRMTNVDLGGTISFDAAATNQGYAYLYTEGAAGSQSLHLVVQQGKFIVESAGGLELRGIPLYGDISGGSNVTKGVANVLKVTDYGANVADGLDDSLAVSNAFWAATNGNAGGEIFVPIGTAHTTNPIYLVDSPVLGNFGNSKVKFRGMSRGASAIQFDNITNKFGILANVGMPQFNDLSLIANNSPGSIGIWSTNNGYPSPLNNLYMSGWDTAIKIDPLAGGEIRNTTLSNGRVGLWLPGYSDAWDVRVRGDNNTLATLIVGGPTSIDPTISRVHAGHYYADGVGCKYVAIAGSGYGNVYHVLSEQGTGPVVAVGHPPVYFPTTRDQSVGGLKLSDFYSFDNSSFSNITTLTRVGTTATATLNGSLVSNMFIGQAVTIANVTPSAYNGTFQISAIPSTTTINYVMASDPGASGSQLDGTGMKLYPSWPYAELYSEVGQLIMENASPGGGIIIHSATNTADSAIITLSGVDVRAPGQAGTNGAIFMTSTGVRIMQSDPNQTFNGQINGSWEYYCPAIGTNVIVKISSNGVYSAHSASANFDGNGRNITNMLSGSVSDFNSAAVNAAGTYQYDVDASNYFARAGSTLAFAEKLLVNQLVLNGKAHGWWTNCEAIYPLRGSTAVSCAQNLKQNAYNITWSGTVSFGSNGVTAANSDSQGDTGFLPSVNGGSSQIVKQDSMHIYVFNRTANPVNVANDGCAFMGTFGNNNTKAYMEHNGNGSTALFGNGPNGQVAADSDTSLTAGSSFYGHIMVTRTTANATALYFNNQSNLGSSSSTALPDLDVVLFRRYPAAAGGNHIYNGTLAFATIGGGMSAAQYTAFKTDIDAYVTGASNLVTQAGAFMPRGEVQSSSAAVYAAGTAASFTASAALLTFGTASPSLTITNAGTYLIQAHAQLRYNAATYDATVGRTATIKLRRTNNTAADLSNASRSINLRPSITTFTDNAGTGVVPPVIYTATAGDVVELWGSVTATPSAGAVDATSAEIVAVKIY